ncbi:MAG: hypothetical protein RLY66_306 [Candidatus Parcubacteria bacterium]|jgi:hypothetical protein
MNIINSTTKYIALASMSFVLVFGAISIAPTQAHACIKALGFLDPLCVISGDAQLPGLDFGNDDPQTVTNTNTYTNSNNVNSNINSPGAVVGAPVAYNQTPVYNYDYDYNYYDNNQGALQASCYPMPLNIDEGDRATWQAQAYGGNGSYYFSWSGTDGLSGTGQAISKRYSNEGYKSATVTVRSGNQTVSRNCDGTLRVRDNGYNNNDYPYDYDNDYNYNYPLSVSCSADSSSVNTGRTVRWNSSISGGNGSYNYSWNGTDGLSGSSRSVSRSYNNAGIKYASITVWSNGQTITQSCNNSVNVGGYSSGYPVYPVNNNNSGLDIACYSDPRTVSINQPATWITEVTGGIAPYTYTWSGTDDLTGNTGSVIKYYGTSGNKTAIITIKSADGRSETRACSTSITVRGAGNTTPAPTVDDSKDSDNGLSAAALFSLKNVPWGWVAILIILVLFGTVVYLLFNRPKI